MSKIEIHETNLPGVGLRRDFVTDADDRVGVITHHSGRLDLLVYDKYDPDACKLSLALSEEEGRVLGELIGATAIVKEVANIQQSIGGLALDWIPIAKSWQCIGTSIRDLQLTQTGVLIVAVIRDEETTPVPSPDFVLEKDDTVVVIGEPEGIQQAYKMMQGSD